MKIIEPYFVIEDPTEPYQGIRMLKSIEKAGRTCYKSEDKITQDSAEKFIRMIIGRGHETVLEHEKITVRVVCDRGVSHEIVRHRLASYSQESTRYCNYTHGKFDNELTFIDPAEAFGWTDKSIPYGIWIDAMINAEKSYKQLIAAGAKPQEARDVLPNSIKTEIVITMNLREWRWFFTKRTANDAHPQMKEIARPMLKAFRNLVPVVFDDIGTV